MSRGYVRRSVSACGLTALALAIPVVVTGQANGKLQIHVINVGQGDATLIVSPLGQTLLIDAGPASASNCASATGIITYLQGIGLTQLDYHLASHYDADHIGCSDKVVAVWPVQIAAYDRGTTNPPSTQTYTRYVDSVASKRQTVSLGQQIVLDSVGNRVTFDVKAVNANGGAGSLTENDRSVVVRLTFGSFDAVFGGDLSGDTGSSVHNIEGVFASSVGQVELYKVHHHGSATSSNAAFLGTILPKVATLSTSATNSFGHPTATALNNIHAQNTTVYWTTAGGGASPGSLDVVANNTIVTEVPVNGTTFTVRYGTTTHSYSSWAVPGAPTFTDDPLQAGVTRLKTVHITELRTYVDTLRSRYGLAAVAWTDPTLGPGTTPVKAVHVTELRTALNEVYVAAGRTPPTFTDTLTAGSSPIRAAQITEIRNAILAIY